MKIKAWSSPNCQHNNPMWLQTSVFGSALSVLSFPSPPPAVKHKKALLCNKWSLGKGRTQKITALWESTNQRKDKKQLKSLKLWLKDEMVAVGNQRLCSIPLVQGTFHSQGGFWVSSKVWDQRLMGTNKMFDQHVDRLIAFLLVAKSSLVVLIIVYYCCLVVV